MPNWGSALRKFGLIGGGIMAASAGGFAIAGSLPPPQNVNPDTVLSYYMGARYGIESGAAGAAVGGLAGVLYGLNSRSLGVKGTILSGLLGAGIGGILGAAVAPNVGAGAMVANTMGMTDQMMSGGTYSAVNKIAALNASIARLHRPIRGMGY